MQCSHLADFFQRIGDLLEQGQIIFGNIPYILVYKSICILRQEIASLKILPVYKSTPQFENILE